MAGVEVSVLFRRDADNAQGLVNPTRTGQWGSSQWGRASQKRAMHHSIVWGATRLRADLLSLMPVDVYRKSGYASIEVAKPNVLVEPSEVAEGQPMPIGEWMYSTQSALDGTGNTIGIIRATDGFGLPAKIEPVDMDRVSFRIKGSKIIEYRIAGETVDAKYIWHERQYTIAGVPVGLSPITHAAMPLAAGMSAQEFALAWFTGGAVPSAILRNTDRKLDRKQALEAKESFKASIKDGDLWTTGKEWEYTPVQAKAMESGFIEQMQYTDLDLCRFMGVPADMLDVSGASGSNVTYANITQRNLQLLVMNLGGAVKRREDSLSRLVPAGRFVKLNRSAVLAMDEKTRAELFKIRIESRTITPDQVRAHEDEAPLSEADYAQFDRLFPSRTPQQPQTAGSNP